MTNEQKLAKIRAAFDDCAKGLGAVALSVKDREISESVAAERRAKFLEDAVKTIGQIIADQDVLPDVTSCDFDKNLILVVDDDPDILKMIPIMLQADLPGVNFVGARDGVAALEVFKGCKLKPALIILDMMLPKMAGFLVYDKIRRLYKKPLPRVLMITGNMGQRHRTYAQELGIDDFMNKPFRAAALVTRVQALMHKVIADLEPK